MWREHINGEYVGNSRLYLHPSRLAIADACIVDHAVKATELIDLVGNGSRSGDRSQVPSHGSLCADRRHERVATSPLIAPVQDDLVALLDQEPGCQETQAVG
jgi:hypothetical protein